ncbi:hypothetical protein O181_084993 [Austropuccinia psidii MF-1]|uniref:Uncharacterized protein n=1 Tax=Austropuccinia psidii MF-1 TaxID=1389203 RepID=A0A9Q3FWN5_9BASI|nr:hypothetical protein [Austropuccinia psidii MF-1]
MSKTTFKGLGEVGEEEEENSMEEEESNGTEFITAPLGAYEVTGGKTIAKSNHPVCHQSDPSLWAIMQEVNKIMANY